MTRPQQDIYDFVVIGSGFGGSVAALRLAEKGYSMLVIERGKRYRDQDFAKSNWAFWKYLWNPALRSFGILQISLLDGMLVLHGSGVGGGSLGYANVLMEPDDQLFAAPAWSELADWKAVLRPHYATAKRMLGVAPTPKLFAGDRVLQQVAVGMDRGASFGATEVGVYFGKEGVKASDPYFGGQGPARVGCIYCGACMVGCRHNAKNTLVKNYLYLAEALGVEVLAEQEVRDVRPLSEQADGARYEIVYRSSTSMVFKTERRVRAHNVVLSAGVMGTLKLLFRCRDVTGSLPGLSARLGDEVRTNSEALLGATARDDHQDYSQGVAIGSIFAPDEITRVEAVRYPDGSSLMRFLAAPLIMGGGITSRLLRALGQWLRHPIDFLRGYILPGWARRTTILLVMQTLDSRMRVRLGRRPWTLFRRGLVSEQDQEKGIPAHIRVGHEVTERFANEIEGVAAGSLSEGLFGMPATAHMLGGVPMGRSAEDGVVDTGCQVHGYPGLYVVDGSVVPANPGINPSLTITALAEYALSLIPKRKKT